MARSTYVYTVFQEGYTLNELLGTFTVKHEMVTAISRWRVSNKVLGRVAIYRSYDGRLKEPEDITDEFEWEPV